MVRLLKYSVFCYCLLQGFGASLNAQQSAIYNNGIDEYKTGLELYEKGKFGSAQKQFAWAMTRTQNPDAEVSVNSEYYAALCALELFNKDAEHLLTQFIENHPESPRVKIVYFQLGKYSFRKKRWENVIEWFEKVDMFDLTKEEVAEYHFKKGYSHFMLDDYENAGKILYEIKDVDTRYTDPARYYYAHVAYKSADYQTALEGFAQLSADSKFSMVVPYYITQIYYMQQKYDELIAYAPVLLDSATPKRAPEIARLIGDSYYKTDRFKEAIPFLEEYKRFNYNLPLEDQYQMGYAYYKSGDYGEAIKIFNKISVTENEISQTAFYHLADCYLKTGKKKFARNAFKSACQMDFDEKIKEDALYNYALLSYELSYDPYNKSIDAFKEYIEKYPNSEKAEDAWQYLINVYMTTRNYKAAMQSIESVANIDERLKGAYQRVAYNSAVEYFHNSDYQQAILDFKKVMKYPVDRHLNSMSLYWTGEANYQLKKYDDAIAAYKKFIFEPGAILQKEFNQANYNIAYVYFNQKDYANAINYFRKFTADNNEDDIILLTDANLRIADAYFLTNDYYKAEGFYQKAIELKGPDTDYAIYQRAMAFGILKKQGEKTGLLESLINGYPSSKYLVDAKYQLGKEYMHKDKTEQALAFFKDVIDNYPNSSYVKKCLLNTGLIYFNAGKNEEALAVFKRIVHDYPTYDDSREALAPIKNIYVKLGKVDEYAAFMNSLSFTNVTEAELDSVTYEAAELQYMNGDCKNARTEFGKYLDKFENAIFAINAHFYKGECEFKEKNYEEALRNYNAVIDRPLNKFTESALVKASRINYANHNFEEALNNYMMLEKIAEYKSNVSDAKIGQMKCFFFLENYPSAMDYAQRVLQSEKINQNTIVEAHVTIARSALTMDSLELAYQEFSLTASITQSEMGAESKYFMAKIRFDQGNYKQAEEQVYELVNRTPGYAFWVAKGLILLSDIYTRMDDLFQAKATLQSILDNYSGNDDIKDIANKKLQEIVELEKPKEEESLEKMELEVGFEGISNEEIDELFDEEEIIEEQ